MKKKIDFDILESLRGMAALYVCIAHCRGVIWIGGEHYSKLHPRSTWGLSEYLFMGLNMLTRLSTEFVIIFFVLSGFSIAHSLRKNRNPLDFYKRRFIRLYPPYIAAIIWAMFVTGLLLQIFPHFFDGTYKTLVFDRLQISKGLFDFKTILGNLFYMPQMNGMLNPFWSLTHEVIFYLLAPFLVMNRRFYLTGSILLFLTVNVLFAFNYIPHTILTDFVYYNFFFAFGVGLYHNYSEIEERVKFLTKNHALYLALALFFAMIPLSFSQKLLPVNAMLAAFFSLTLITYLLSNNKRIKWLIWIGKFSYTLYITHFSTIFLYLGLYYLITKASPPYIFNGFIFIPCIFFCILVAYLHYSLVERKTKKALDKMRVVTPVIEEKELTS